MDFDGEDLGLLDNSGSGDGGAGDEGFEEIAGDEGDQGGSEGGERDGEGAEGGGEGGEEDQGSGSRSIVKLEPLAIRKALREITTTNPDFAKKFPALEKAVTTALFKSGQVEKLGGVQAISEAVEALEVHGGIEGIQTMVDELELTRELEKGFERGDPKVVDGWAKDYPAGFKKLIVPSLDKLKEIDKDFFYDVSSYTANEIFDSHGVFAAFARLGEALGTLEAGKDGGAIKQFNSIAAFLTQMKELAGKAKSGRQDRDPDLDEDRKNLAKEKRDMIYSSARNDVNPKLMFEMNRLIRQALPKGMKVRVERANHLRKEINSETRIRMNRDSDFSSTFESLLAAGNKDRLAQFILKRAMRHLPKVVPQLMKELGFMDRGSGGGTGGNNGMRRTAGNRGGGGSNSVFGRPKTEDVDFTRTDKAVWISSIQQGKAVGPIFLKTGKEAKW